MEKLIDEVIRKRAERGEDPLRVLGRLLANQILITANTRWVDGELQIAYFVNDALPRDLPEKVAELFLALAEGRPDGCHGTADHSVMVELAHDGWVWRIALDDHGVEQSVPAAGALLADLPGNPTAAIDLVAGDDKKPFRVQITTEGDEMVCCGEMNGSEFTTRCERSAAGLMGVIQEMHAECCTCEGCGGE